MKKKLFLFLSVLLLTATQSKAANITLTRVSVHDPSVVYEPTSKNYYIFGTHRGLARSKNLMSWASTPFYFGLANDEGKITSRLANTGSGFGKFFKTNMTKTVTIDGQERTFGNFDVEAWAAAASANYGLDGNMWAPDIVYNKKMKKWCLYFSINGDNWASSIVLLTADEITGPYVYQGPVVFSGFNVKNNLSYQSSDLELAIGMQSSLPARYNVGGAWGNRWPNCIDPCVFYDEDGKLWMTYGSWSGGIWMLQLNEENGLRDYNVKYPTAGSGDGVTSDPYFGKKIAGGYYVSGEGSYIEYINGYYYLFMSYGFMLSAENGNNDQKNQGGYQMRVFRSEKPDGPYRDNRNQSAIYTSYVMNYGPNAKTTRGVNIFGAYSGWGHMSLGEREQGHNSIIAAEDGRTYLVYHTRFQDNTQGHAVRVHQVFQNEDGWLVVAPFEYTGEKVKSADIATTQQVEYHRIPGAYKLLIHRYGLDYVWGKQETVTPVDITLCSDGSITGNKTGSWQLVDGTSYINLTIGGTTYKGVMVDQVMETNTTQWPNTTFTDADNKTVAFTALANNGVTVWGYRSGDDPTGVGGALHLNDKGKMINDILFDLQGRRISSPSQKGIYIINGKKTIK